MALEAAGQVTAAGRRPTLHRGPAKNMLKKKYAHKKRQKVSRQRTGVALEADGQDDRSADGQVDGSRGIRGGVGRADAGERLAHIPPAVPVKGAPESPVQPHIQGEGTEAGGARAYISADGGGGGGGGGAAAVRARVMRDFVGMERVNEEGRRALVEFRWGCTWG